MPSLPFRLLTISPEAWNIPTIEKFVPLLDNYERDTLVNEYVTPQVCYMKLLLIQSNFL